ncbi:MAG: radical SAM protein, partial [Muribaculaceae bacterium]|nr:radical SAM protein [Muribaculaceae bacterium]
LGVNLSPNDGKVCTFDCLYCEAGYNAQGPGTTGLPSRAQVAQQLEAKLRQMKAEGQKLDVITFSGNGEPTAHPDFGGIIDDVIALRDKYFPAVKISVLSNSTQLGRPEVESALRRVDNNIVKLDSAIDSTIRVLDRPTSARFNADEVIRQIARFGPQCIVQTMILTGRDDNGNPVDNTTDTEIDALIDAYRRINPNEVMLYSIDRPTPARNLHKVSREELERIAERIRRAGIAVQVS